MAQRNKNRSTTMTVRLDARTKKSLEEIAAHEKRSKSFLAAEAIASYIAFHEAQTEGIKKAMASIDSGSFIPHEKVKEWAQSLGTDNELPMPEPETRPKT